MVQAGQYVTDGTAVFLVCDIRDGAQVGDVKMSPILRKGYVKANGALLSNARENYPRLITFLNDNPSLKAANDTAWNRNKALYVYNSSANTLRVPDATGRVLQGGASVQSVEAGLPNVTGTSSHGLQSEYGSNDGTSWIGAIGLRYGSNGAGTQNSSKSSYEILLDASRSNPIYSASTTVQPPALTMIPQIRY